MRKEAIIIIPSETIEINGIDEYIPCVVIEGNKGYRLTDWHWGNDLEFAEKLAIEYNEKSKITKREVRDLIIGSMRFN